MSGIHRADWRTFPKARPAFTLVELLVVIAIIGILVSLLMPAVQAARESGRQTQCKNNLKQLATGFQVHHEQMRFFPTGGWDYDWVGDPNAGFGRHQPGGWVFNVLPFIEQQALHDLGMQTSGSQSPNSANAQREVIPLGAVICPSRRTVQTFTRYCCDAKNTDSTPFKARSCYAANNGDTIGEVTWTYDPTQPNSSQKYNSPGSLSAGTDSYAWPNTTTYTGISFIRSEINAAHIKDGLSNTYMLGEKYINPDHYLDGVDGGDDWSMYTGQQDDIYRGSYCSDTTNPATCITPTQDTPGLAGNPSAGGFGGPHPGVCNFAFCDGSVHAIAYAIDPEVHRRLCNRRDGLVVDGSKY